MTTSLWGATEDSEEPVFCVFLHRFVASQVASMTICRATGRDRWLASGIALALGAVTLLVYWPARHFDFLNWDDLTYVSKNDHVRGGLTWNGFPLVLHPQLLEQLAPVDLALAHARLPALRVESRRAPPDQLVAPRRERQPAVSGVAAAHRRALAQRVCGGLVRAASAACRVGRLDRRTQGRAERVLLHADALGLRPLCGRQKVRKSESRKPKAETECRSQRQ